MNEIRKSDKHCDGCWSVSINGIACHEHGCPNNWIDLNTGEPYRTECNFCGSLFVPAVRYQSYCDQICKELYEDT